MGKYWKENKDGSHPPCGTSGKTRGYVEMCSLVNLVV